MGFNLSRPIGKKPLNSVCQASVVIQRKEFNTNSQIQSQMDSQILKDKILHQLELIDQRLSNLHNQQQQLQEQVTQIKNKEKEEEKLKFDIMKIDKGLQTSQLIREKQFDQNWLSQSSFLTKKDMNSYDIQRTNKNKINKRLQDARDQRKKMLQIKIL